MQTTGKCVLCAGKLVHETEVYVSVHGTEVTCYQHAWVCTQCGAAWPIAVARRDGFLLSVEHPLWQGGKRQE